MLADLSAMKNLLAIFLILAAGCAASDAAINKQLHLDPRPAPFSFL